MAEEMPAIDPLWHDENKTTAIVRTLVKMIEGCHQLRLGDRVDVFTVLQNLKEAKHALPALSS